MRRSQNMVLIDANAILRYMLIDNIEMAQKTKSIIESRKIYVGTEVIAEVIYVLERVYKLSRSDIADGLLKFFRHENIYVESHSVLSTALDLYALKNFDFVDTILYAKNRIYGYDVFTFDKKLKTSLNQQSEDSYK